MKIATWNVNSVRSRLDRLLAWLQKAQPDVLCLQELKAADAHGGRRGVAVYVRESPTIKPVATRPCEHAQGATTQRRCPSSLSKAQR
jgi:hypothetical protein